MGTGDADAVHVSVLLVAGLQELENESGHNVWLVEEDEMIRVDVADIGDPVFGRASEIVRDQVIVSA